VLVKVNTFVDNAASGRFDTVFKEKSIVLFVIVLVSSMVNRTG